MKKLLIYDLDGTLVDTGEDIARAANFMLEFLGASKLEPSEIYAYVGKGLFYLIGSCLKTQDQKQIEKGAKIYRKHYSEHMMDHSKLFPGALDFLELFKTCTQAVITNKPDPFATEMLQCLKVASYFTQIVAGDAQFPKKPDPSSILDLMKAAHCEASEVVMIGDSLIDHEMARRAGVESILLTHGFSSFEELASLKPDGLVKNFSELRQFAIAKRW